MQVQRMPDSLPRLRPAYPGQNLLALIRRPIDLLTAAAKQGDIVRLSDGGQET